MGFRGGFRGQGRLGTDESTPMFRFRVLLTGDNRGIEGTGSV
jgi:hypothetical protein